MTFNSGITLDLGGVRNFMIDGTLGGGTMSMGGGLDMETPGGALQAKTLDLAFRNINFPQGSTVYIRGPEDSNIVFDRDHFTNDNAPSDCSGYGNQFYLDYSTANGTTPSGVTIQNSTFTSPGSLNNPNRAIQTAAPMTVAHNVFTGYLDEPGCNHIDVLQQYGGGYGNITFVGNLCYDDYDCFAAWDGTQNNTITDNVCYSIERSCIDLYADRDSVVNHNTIQAGGANQAGCVTHDCTSGVLLEYDAKSGGSSGGVFTNNVGEYNLGSSSSFATNSHNLFSGASAPNINGRPTFLGGAAPTNWSGFQLAARSAGHRAASDGADVGIRALEGVPPGS